MTTLKRHATGYLRNLSQSFFFDDAYFGAGLLVLLFCFESRLFIWGLTASLIGYAQSMRHSTPRVIKDYGLIPINCFFFGLAMAGLFQDSTAAAICLVLGSVAIPLLTKACFSVFQVWKLTPVILPYILAVWVVWLCGQSGFSLEVNPDTWPESLALVPALYPDWNLAERLFWSSFQSVGRLLFLPNPYFGLSLFALVAVFSPRRGAYFLMGTTVSLVFGYLLSTPTSGAWEQGYLSYCAGLIGLGLAAFPEKFGWRTIGLFCTLSSFLTLALEPLLKAAHLPILSLPYVLTLWLALLSRLPRVSLSWAQSKPLYQRPAPWAAPAPSLNAAALLNPSETGLQESQGEPQKVA